MFSAYHRLVSGLTANKLADLLISAKTTLPALLVLVGAPTWMSSVLVPIRESGALLPQGIIGYGLRHYRLRHRVWRLGLVIQILSLLCVLCSALMLSGKSAGYAILVTLVVLSVGRAASSLTMKDIQANTIAKGKRGRLLGVASSASGLLTLLIAVPLLIFHSQLDESVSLGLVIGAICALLVSLLILLPLHAVVEKSADDAPSERRRWQFDSVVYRFIVVRGVFVHSALAAPYFMLSGEQSAFTLLPAYIAAQALASMLSSFLWGRIADYNARLTLQLAGVIGVIACLGFVLYGSGTLWGSAMCFFLLAVAHAGVRTGRKTYSLDVNEGQARTELVAFSNSAIGVILLALGGVYAWVASQVSINMVYVMASGLTLGVLLTLILPAEKRQ